MASICTHPGEHSKLGKFGLGEFRLGRPHRHTVRFAAVLLVAAGLSGCQSINMNSAQLRVIDASPDAGVVDSYQGSSALAYNLGFGTMTSYVPMIPGNYTLATDKAGTRQTLVASTDTLVAGKEYTEIVGSSLVNMQQTVFEDQNAPAPAGQIEVRLINEATRSGAVDVYLVPMSGRLANMSPVAVDLNFGTTSGYITLPAGTYAIDVVPTGTTLVSSTVTLLSGAQIDYASGTVRTVVLIDREIVGSQHAALTPGVQAIIADDVEAQ